MHVIAICLFEEPVLCIPQVREKLGHKDTDLPAQPVPLKSRYLRQESVVAKSCV